MTRRPDANLEGSDLAFKTEFAVSCNQTENSEMRTVRVFVSSPSDVTPERGRVQAVAAKLNGEYGGLVRFETILWEEHIYTAERSFQPQIAEPVACDVVVSIFWTRI